MKPICFTMTALLVLALGLTASAEEKKGKKGKKFGDVSFLAYEGTQKWPTSDKSTINKDHAVPIYFGLPGKSYKVLGRLYDARKSGIGVVGRELAHIFSEKERLRDCADQAKYSGGDAVLVTDNEEIIKAFSLSKKEMETTSPLKEQKDKVTLAIKLE